ncbi:MAG: lycopene cyclase domain-containing protein [Candidatus Nanopelagicales bacterium]
MTYTQLVVVGVAVTCVLDLLVLRTRVLTRRVFWVSYAIVIIFQLLTNGVLTGQEIVRYDGDQIIGTSAPQFLGDGRIAYAPVEDLLFGFSLVVQSLAWWVWWGRRGVQRLPLAGPPRWRDEPPGNESGG